MGATAEDKRTYTIYDLRAILGIGRTSAQRLVHTGKFRSVRVGGSIRIVKSSFDAWMKTGDGQSYLSGLQGAKGNGSDCPRKHNPGSASSKIAENDESQFIIRYVKTEDGVRCLNSDEEKAAVLKMFLKDPDTAAMMKDLLGREENAAE